MPLTGQAKTDYQREYMRRRRSNQRSNVTPESVRPEKQQDVRPDYYLETVPGSGMTPPVTLVKKRTDRIEKQSYNPMMVGYVPPNTV